MRIFNSLPRLSLVIAINITIAAIFSYFELIILAYIFYIIPMLLVAYTMFLVFRGWIKSRQEYKTYLKNKGQIDGLILNKNNQPFSLILVRLMNLDGSVGPHFSGRYYTATNKFGRFKMKYIPYGKYLLQLTYKDSSQTFPIEITKDDQHIDFIKIL